MAAPFKNKTILKILDYYKNVWALGRLAGVAHWDLETYMPVKGAGARGEMLARVASVRQKIFLDKNFVDLIHQSEKEKNLTDQEKGVIRVLLRDLKFYEKLPAEFLEEFEKLTNTGTVVWREAKDKNKYELFEPYLTKIFEMNRKMADYLGFDGSPYDALLDQFEEGLTVSQVEAFFGQIRVPLINLLTRIVRSKKYEKTHSLETEKYNEVKMQELNLKVLKTFRADFGRLRLDVSAHPFTTSFSCYDTRITTRYHKTDFARSIFSTVHEFGHALYDLQCMEGFDGTPIQGGHSLVIHESQSRFWENFIGRSEEFAGYFKKDFDSVISKRLSVQQYYRYFNKVAANPIRTESDEVSYHFHIMLRFEIERGIIEGTIKTKDVREIWNAKIKEYLGITPKDDSEGVLQDVHWSMGSVGYFPTYSMGTFVAAQWAKEIGEVSVANIAKIQKWLGEHIHQYGGTYTLAELLRKNKMQFDPKVNLDYLNKKYSEIYSL